MTINVSPEVLAELLGKSATEVSSLFVKDGEPVENAGEILSLEVKARMSEVVERDKLDKKSYRDQKRAEAFKEVNSYLKEKGAEGEDWKEQVNSIVSTDRPKTEIDTSKYTDVIRKLTEDLETEKSAHLQTVNGHKQKEDNSTIRKYVMDYVNNPENNYVLPENETIRNKAIDNLFKELVASEKRFKTCKR